MQNQAELKGSDEPIAQPDFRDPDAVDVSRLFSKDWLLNLAKLLQTTLNVEQLMQTFNAETIAVLRFDSFSYRYPAQGCDISFGETADHSCSYRLVLSEEHLGEVVFTRRTPFQEAETLRLEYLTSQLVYPLRNALLYQQAMLAAATDPLTGAFNRSTLELNLKREISLAQRHDQPLGLLMLDLDHFKEINDRFGHPAGDCMLKAFAREVVRNIRNSDELFRYGGEEFVVLLSNTDITGATQLAERVRQGVETMRTACDGHTLGITVSIGVAILENQEQAEDLLKRADQALYHAKSEGRNRVIRVA